MIIELFGNSCLKLFGDISNAEFCTPYGNFQHLKKDAQLISNSVSTYQQTQSVALEAGSAQTLRVTLACGLKPDSVWLYQVEEQETQVHQPHAYCSVDSLFELRYCPN